MVYSRNILQINDVWFEILQCGLLDTKLLYLQALKYVCVCVLL